MTPPEPPPTGTEPGARQLGQPLELVRSHDQLRSKVAGGQSGARVPGGASGERSSANEPDGHGGGWDISKLEPVAARPVIPAGRSVRRSRGDGEWLGNTGLRSPYRALPSHGLSGRFDCRLTGWFIRLHLAPLVPPAPTQTISKWPPQSSIIRSKSDGRVGAAQPSNW